MLFEVTIDESMSYFLNVLRRFVSTKGPVKHIYSDNETNFIGCARLMQKFLKKWNQESFISLQQMNVASIFNFSNASHMVVFGNALFKLQECFVRYNS